MTDPVTQARDLMGDAEGAPSILDMLNKTGNHGSTRSGFLHYRILYFIALNPESSRYRISRELRSPHSTTVKAVQDLCTNGLIRAARSQKAKTGLVTHFYTITSFGLQPILDLYSGVIPFYRSDPRHSTAMALWRDVGERFAKISEISQHLPLLGFFFQRWKLLQSRGVERHFASILSYCLREELLYHKSGPLRTLEGRNRNAMPRDVLVQSLNKFETAFRSSLAREIINGIRGERQKERDLGYREITTVFSLDPSFRDLLRHGIKEFEQDLRRDLLTLRFLKRLADQAGTTRSSARSIRADPDMAEE